MARDYGEGREPTPKPGDFEMMLEAKGVQSSFGVSLNYYQPLSHVDQAFAWDEGGRGPHTRVVARRPLPPFH